MIITYQIFNWKEKTGKFKVVFSPERDFNPSTNGPRSYRSRKTLLRMILIGQHNEKNYSTTGQKNQIKGYCLHDRRSLGLLQEHNLLLYTEFISKRADWI